MSNLYYAFAARAGEEGQSIAGLTPTWVFLKRLEDGADVQPPAISEIQRGQYKFAFDAEQDGDCTGQVDLGEAVPGGARYVDLFLYRSDARMTFNLDAPVSSRSTFAGGPVAVQSVVPGAITAAALAADVRALLASAPGQGGPAIDPQALQALAAALGDLARQLGALAAKAGPPGGYPAS